MAKSKRHIHKYHKVSVNGVKVWACALPDCNHHMPKHYENMVEGKASYCWGCNEEMVLDGANMKHDRPFCISCRISVNLDSLKEDDNSTKNELSPRLADLLKD